MIDIEQHDEAVVAIARHSVWSRVADPMLSSMSCPAVIDVEWCHERSDLVGSLSMCRIYGTVVGK